MKCVSLIALVLASAPSFLVAQEPSALDSRVERVVVHPGVASISRIAQLAAGDGLYRIDDLPLSADKGSFRVRLERGVVGSLEVTDRVVEAPDPPGATELEAQLELLRAKLLERRDSLAVNATLRKSVSTMLELTETQGQTNLREGQPDPVAWGNTLRFVADELAKLNDSDRKLHAELRGIEKEIQELESKIAKVRASATTTTKRSLTVKVLAAAGRLELDYLVPHAGWEPLYDLRADERVRNVELVYRAKVWQNSGEDWDGARLTLSTARPKTGARGPDPVTCWLGLGTQPTLGATLDGVVDYRGSVESLSAGRANKVPMTDSAVLREAVVNLDGPIVRFELPTPESIRSGSEPTQVLIGRANLDVSPEHVCVPELDTTVWLRGRTKNTSPFVMLAGEASVHLGSSFLGKARFDHVRKDEEFTLHLGADEGVTVTRTRLEKNEGSSGVFHKRVELDTRWRIEVTNHDGLATAKGGLRMIVHESIPKSAHEDLEIKVTDVSPAFADSERWKTFAEEKGAGTWDFLLGQGESKVFEIATRMRHPNSTFITRR